MESKSLIVFRPTGEVRYPKKGEWFVLPTDDMTQAYRDGLNQYPIYERIEIEVPEGATEANVAFYSESHVYNKFLIHLSRPKVKKWLWERDYDNSHTSNMKVVTKIPFSEKEIWGDGNRWRRVPGTEIEVEED